MILLYDERGTMSSQTPIWISEAEVVSLIDLGEAITAVRAAYAGQADGTIANLPKAQQAVSDTVLHATGAVSAPGGLVGAKTWARTARGATPLMNLWSADDGSLVAVIEAFALGQYRTAAVSGVATDLMASPDATELAILGTGSQALAQVAAVKSVRQLSAVRVWSPRSKSRQRFCSAVEKALGLATIDAETVDKAADGAGVITTITRAETPFLSADAVTAGAHVNALGAIRPDRAELSVDLLRRAERIAVDDVESARSHSRELGELFGSDREDTIVPLADAVAAGPERPAGSGVSVLKAMGAGVGDLAIASFVLEQAQINRLGVALPVPARSRPRLRSTLERPAVGYV
jgi:alanine dehydrogenase